MTWFVLAAAAYLGSNVCAARERRCELRCAQDNVVGTLEHQKCNVRCWEDQRACNDEGSITSETL